MINLFVYIALGVATFLNIVIPVSGSSTVTPFLAIITDPHKAIGLASFFFALSGLIRIYMFKNKIKWHFVKKLIVLSLIGAIIGAFALFRINSFILYIIILIFALYFLYKKIRENPQKDKDTTKKNLGVHFIGLLSGFLQGTGLAGSDLRNSYLFSKKLDLAEVHGTTAVIGTTNFLTATLIRLLTNQITVPDLIPLFYLLPPMILATWLGRYAIYKINKKYTNILIILIMIIIVIFLIYKILSL